MKIRYKRKTIEVKDFERPSSCQICNRVGRTEGHHTKYAYTSKEVKKNHKLALENVVFVCFQCHIPMNAIRILEEAYKRNPNKLLDMFSKHFKNTNFRMVIHKMEDAN